ncbi:MAG: metal-sulfur cluster assembly factor [bacterium JZ-2024 1]
MRPVPEPGRGEAMKCDRASNSPDCAIKESCLTALKEVYDPEMPVSLVDLGLIYRLEVASGDVLLDISFTATACPAAEMIAEDIRARLRAIPGVNSVSVNIVWDPPWSRDRITPEGKALLRIWGLAI